MSHTDWNPRRERHAVHLCKTNEPLDVGRERRLGPENRRLAAPLPPQPTLLESAPFHGADSRSAHCPSTASTNGWPISIAGSASAFGTSFWVRPC